MHVLANERLRIEVSELGAEIRSIKSVEDGVEYLWQGDPNIWTGRAPILFPIVGALKNNQFEIDRGIFELPRHGLARKAQFAAGSSDQTSVQLSLQSNTETLKIFPWAFLFEVTYSLQNNSINIDYHIQNKDVTSMSFAIGSHPAFNLAKPVDQYRVHFSHHEELLRYSVNREGLLHETAAPYPLEQQSIAITPSLFNDDALIFKHVRSNIISLHDRENELVRIHTGNAPHLGIWAKPAAPFVCIEPWFGYSDSVRATGLWKDKPAMLTLDTEASFSHQWAIEITSIGG